MRGRFSASSGAMRGVPGIDGSPSVSGSPGYSKRYWMLPRWIPSGRAPLPLGVDGSLDEAVLLGIGVDDQPAGALLLGDLGLHPAEALAVAGEHDLAPDVHAQLGQCLVVLRQPVVDIDDLPAARRPRASRRCSPPRPRRRSAATDSGAPCPGPVEVGRGHGHLDALRPRDVDVVGRGVHGEPVGAQPVDRVRQAVGQARGADQLRAPAQRSADLPGPPGADRTLEALLRLELTPPSAPR